MQIDLLILIRILQNRPPRIPVARLLGKGRKVNAAGN